MVLLSLVQLTAQRGQRQLLALTTSLKQTLSTHQTLNDGTRLLTFWLSMSTPLQTFPPRNQCAWHGLIALDSLLHPISMVLYYSKSYSAFDSFQSNAQGAKRDALAADVDRLPDQEAIRPAKTATGTWIEIATERELNLSLKLSDQAFIDSVKAKGPAQPAGVQEKIDQAARDYPLFYSPRLAAVSPFWFGEVFQQGTFYTATFAAIIVPTYFVTRRAHWLRNFAAVPKTDQLMIDRWRHRLGMPHATPDNVEADLRSFSIKSFCGRGATLAYIATFIGTRIPEFLRKRWPNNIANTATKAADTATKATNTTKAVDTATKVTDTTTKAADTATRSPTPQ
ncbi:hypothetical protein PROFUN_14959 [Planoprotostelium fungivorum]|uniref:Uncharacterized protein n=1 Tax=Planoprotostelium fungivorum TaxID=1890364 RepID=A0A2P6MY97_9EUKA|nr:hypothetical protein PROFUN_14959 [Planoprotostelium fungivorum]